VTILPFTSDKGVDPIDRAGDADGGGVRRGLRRMARAYETAFDDLRRQLQENQSDVDGIKQMLAATTPPAPSRTAAPRRQSCSCPAPSRPVRQCGRSRAGPTPDARGRASATRFLTKILYRLCSIHPCTAPLIY
jgi:hypothetical protein